MELSSTVLAATVTFLGLIGAAIRYLLSRRQENNRITIVVFGDYVTHDKRIESISGNKSELTVSRQSDS
jgi:hypothetical protein